MEIDFHFAVTYVVARLAEFDEDEAEIIATASQYVDDTVNSGILKFETGEAFYRKSTAHDVMDLYNLVEVDEYEVWVPFHFLPGGCDSGFFDRMICQPNSATAQQMVRACIEEQDQPYGLHRLGITAHVYADTWAHQGFAGVAHRINSVKKLRLECPKEAWADKVSIQLAHWKELCAKRVLTVLCHVMNWVEGWCGPVHYRHKPPLLTLGHAEALHYPDHPFRTWSYRNGHGQPIPRDNVRIFVEAAEALYRMFRRYRLRDPNIADADIGALPDRDLIEVKLRGIQEEDAKKRKESWLKAIHNGEFSFRAYPKTPACFKAM
jgi:hypothetical protein